MSRQPGDGWPRRARKEQSITEEQEVVKKQEYEDSKNRKNRVNTKRNKTLTEKRKAKELLWKPWKLMITKRIDR